jgi:hypothetical protein
MICINELCTPEQQQSQTFKESYRCALGQIVARFLPELLAELTAIVADYATYDPVIDFELCKPEYKELDKAHIVRSKKKKKGKRSKPSGKRCVIQ